MALSSCRARHGGDGISNITGDAERADLLDDFPSQIKHETTSFGFPNFRNCPFVEL